MPTYKNRSSSAYIENLGEILSANTQIARLFFDVMNVRQYDKDNMEADDLIYSAATVLHPHRSMIVSTDSDLTQIPFMLSSSQVYDPHKAIIVDTPSYHPAYMKAISGDKADSIKGYVGIGIKRGSTLMEDEMKLQVFLDERGRERFNLNLLVTDLSLNPKLLANRIYVKKIMGRPVVFDKEKIGDLVKSYKIVGLDSEYADLIPPFQRLS